MLTKIKLVVAAVIVLGTASGALARGYVVPREVGGYLVPGSLDGVNPAYHPRWFPQYACVLREYGRANRAIYSGVGGYYPDASTAYGWVGNYTPRPPRCKHHRG